MLEAARVSVAPLRYGAGVKGKVGAALAAGLPTVGTAVAVEGMSLEHGVHILVAETPKGLAEAIAKIYGSRSLWNQLSERGCAYAEKNYGYSAAFRNLQAIINRLMINVQDIDVHPLPLYRMNIHSDVSIGEKQ